MRVMQKRLQVCAPACVLCAEALLSEFLLLGSAPSVPGEGVTSAVSSGRVQNKGGARGFWVPPPGGLWVLGLTRFRALGP